MVKLTPDEFKEIIDNFDEFMAENGYLTIEATAERVYICVTSMYILLQNGKVPGVITVGKKKYIPITWKRGPYKNVPDGYLTIDDMAKKWSCTGGAIRQMIYDGRFKDYITIGRKMYINENAEYPRGRIVQNTPEGYMTIREAAKKFGCTDSTVRVKMYRGELSGDDVLCVGHRYYVSKNATIKLKKKGGAAS